MQEVRLKGYFNNCDYQNKKITVLFLDDAFTRDFLMKYYSSSQNNPIKNGEFYVKFTNNSKCFLDKAYLCQAPIQSLLDNVVNITAVIKHYNFTSNGEKISGWNLNLVHMSIE